MPTPRNNVYRIIWIVGAELLAFGLYEVISLIRRNSQRAVRMAPVPSMKPMPEKSDNAPETSGATEKGK